MQSQHNAHKGHNTKIFTCTIQTLILFGTSTKSQIKAKLMVYKPIFIVHETVKSFLKVAKMKHTIAKVGVAHAYRDCS